MFIELADLLRCPGAHAEAQVVVATGEMIGREIVRGMIGCPVCHAEYRIERRLCRFGAADNAGTAETAAVVPDASALHAFLGLSSPGGYVVLVGSAARAAHGLSDLLGGVHFVGVNAPSDVWSSLVISLLEAPATIPLRTSAVRGAVVGGEYAREPWLGEAARVVLPGLRVVVLSDEGSVEGVERMATGPGAWVGRKGDKRRGMRDE